MNLVKKIRCNYMVGISVDYKKEYYVKHSNLHEDSVEWKVELCKPFLDYLVVNNKISKKIFILDVGESGLILRKVSFYLKSVHKIKVNKYGMDLDRNVLKIQRKNNPDIIQTCKEDLCKKTRFKNKQFDLVLCNDIIEHVYDDDKALKELGRISKYVYFKVPLEKAYIYVLLNILSLGYVYKKLEDNLGHINRYNSKNLNLMIRKYFLIEKYSFSNCFEYFLRKNCPSIKIMLPKVQFFYKLYSYFGIIIYMINPWLAANIMSDFYLVLVKSK